MIKRMRLCNIRLASYERNTNNTYTIHPSGANRSAMPRRPHHRMEKGHAVTHEQRKYASPCRHYAQTGTCTKQQCCLYTHTHTHTIDVASLHLLHPPSRHNTPPALTLDLTPPITLIRHNQNHFLTLLHARLSLTIRIVSVKRFNMSNLFGAAPRSDSGTLLAAY